MYSIRPGVNWDANNHAGLVPYMVECLDHDGYSQYASFLRDAESGDSPLIERVMVGARDADIPISPYWVNVLAHFHNPCTHRGLDTKYSAADAAVDARHAAMREWKGGNYSTACIHIGRCLHLISDAGGIPQHAAGFGYFIEDPWGHRDYENWLKEDSRWQQYAVSSGGFYAPWHSYHGCLGRTHFTVSEQPYDWVDQASATAFRLMPTIDKHRSGYRERFAYAASILVPSVIRWGAGFIAAFLADPEIVATWPDQQSQCGVPVTRSRQVARCGWR